MLFRISKGVFGWTLGGSGRPGVREGPVLAGMATWASRISKKEVEIEERTHYVI